MRNMPATTISTSALDSIWAEISKLNDNIKIELINRISSSMLHHSNTNEKKMKKERFLSLAGAWNDDKDGDAMDKAALDRNSPETRNYLFDD